MEFVRLRFEGLAILVALLAAFPAWAGMGSLQVTVIDGDEFEVPRANVILEGALLTVPQEKTTAASGLVTFTDLPPAEDYRITVTSPVGKSVVGGISIRDARTYRLIVTVHPPQNAIVGTREKAVDTTSTSRGSVLTEEFLQRLPKGRTYQTAVQQAAGVAVGSGQGGNPNPGGATSNHSIKEETAERSQPRSSGIDSTLPLAPSPFVDPKEDRLSTFAIDVDTASYTLARSVLQFGQLPKARDVRLEEFVNAQRYDYPPPAGDAPFAANMEIAPHPFESGRHLLRVAIQSSPPPEERPPVNLTFLVDVSCSMSDLKRLPLAKQALHALVERLGPEDRVALVTYAGDTRVVLEPTRADHPMVHEAIASLENGGGTAMGSGMQLAYGLAQRSRVPGVESRVIALSDGNANIGATTHEQMLDSLRRYADEGITLTTVGFGLGGYNDHLMERLANKGDGASFFIDTFVEAERVFGRDLSSTLVTVARDVKIQVELDPESVLSYRLLGYENRAIADHEFRDDAVDAGEMGSGHQVTALYDLVLSDDPAPVLATVRMRSKPPGPDAPAVERSVQLPSRAARAHFADSTPDFRIAVGAALFAEWLRGSSALQEAGASGIAQIVWNARRNAADAELHGLIETAGELAERTGDTTGDPARVNGPGAAAVGLR